MYSTSTVGIEGRRRITGSEWGTVDERVKKEGYGDEKGTGTVPVQ